MEAKNTNSTAVGTLCSFRGRFFCRMRNSVSASMATNTPESVCATLSKPWIFW